MKAKKLLPVLATLLAASTFCLTACTSNSKTIFGNYWDKNYDPASPTENLNETLTYDVTFTESSSSLLDYGVTYGGEDKKGECVTTLRFDGNGCYVYTVSLSIEVTFDIDKDFTTTDDQKTETYSVSSEAVFLEAKSGLKPVSSKKTIVSPTPKYVSVSNVENCYQLHSYHTETTYNNDDSAVSKIFKDYDAANPAAEPSETKNFTATSEDYNYLDNEQLLAAIRAVPSSTSSTTVIAYNPFDGANKIKLSFENEDAEPFTFSMNGGETTTRNIPYRTVSIVLSSTQTAKIARTEDSTNNVYRNVLLSLETPLGYNIGTLTYTLTSATYA